MVEVLKINKDQVRNFIKQNRRIGQRLTLVLKKVSKSGFINNSMSTLANSLGGATALANNRAVCHGRYNITDSVQGNALYNNMTQCSSKIKEACGSAISTEELSDLSKCQVIMEIYRWKIVSSIIF